jgi:pimeloyl-ACP methyl ester carboxylesterase
VSSITTDQGIVHYEVYGRGRPVILLHGWLGSWGLWQDTMAFLGNEYRTYALDFWGFGESGKKRDSYAISDFVSLVDQFMEQLGILRAPLVGHSMGGTVSLSVAIQYPERVQKVAVIGSPIHGSSLALPLLLAGYRPIAYVVYNLPSVLMAGIRLFAPLITREETWPDMIAADISETTLESFLFSIASLRNTDLREKLKIVGCPIMGMYGNRDVIVSPRQWMALQGSAPNTRIERFNKAGHFPMLDDPKVFMYTLKDFLDSEK